MKIWPKFFSFVLVFLLLIATLPLTGARAAATIYYVKADATGSNNGTSWTNAYTDLQAALTTVASGSEIWVAAGTYKPTSDTDRTIRFVLKNGVAIYGGFAGTETLRSQRNLEANPTILSGDIGTLDDTSDNTYHVVEASGTNATAVLNGFTITAGNANGDISDSAGGGIYIEGASNPSLTNLIIRNNQAVDFGGGMYTKDANLSLANIVFSNNSVAGSQGGFNQGGGLYNISGDLILKNVTFRNNTVTNAGAGMFNAEGDLTLTNVTFKTNTSVNGGGGIYTMGSTLMMTDVTFDGNKGGSGGGIYVESSSLKITNALFNNNSVSQGGGGISSSWSTVLNLTNVTFTNNKAATQDGGAIRDHSNSASSIVSSTFIGNSAGGDGGAIDIDENRYTINNVVFKDNSAGAKGGALYMFLNNSAISNVLFNHNSASLGGAIYNNRSHSPFENVTFVNNSASSQGGGVYNYGYAFPEFTNITFSGNSAAFGSAMYNQDVMSNPVIKNSIFSDTGYEIFNQSSSTISNSLVRGGCPAKSTCKQVISGNPLLGPLANNGGFTQTMALGAGSPAIDTGDTAACPDTDQRGKTRIQGPGCDMGAYEKQQSFIKLISQPANDGWVVESAQGSGTGGSVNTNLPYLLVGDDVQNNQIRAIVSFDTSSLSLPVGAILSGATLKLKLEGVIGGSPFPCFDSLLVDARKGPFSENAVLELVDFNASAYTTLENSIPLTPVDGFYTATWLKNIVPSLAGAGPTQMRLRFTKTTNKNLTSNALKFYSGDSAEAANRPQLMIYYYLP